MQVAKNMTVKGIQSQVFDHALKYVRGLGYEIEDKREHYMIVSKKNITLNGLPFELWLSVAITGESYVTVFMDYQTRSVEERFRKDGMSETTDYQSLLHEIEKEYHGLWLYLTRINSRYS
jgi:hypothetical protein